MRINLRVKGKVCKKVGRPSRRGRDNGSEQSAEVGCGRNEDVEMDVWSHKVGQSIRNE